MYLLFIEDEEYSIVDAKELIESEYQDQGVVCEVLGFEKATDKIASDHPPDIVILDLLADGSSPEPEAEGLKIRNKIWDQHFCPIIIYSAHPDLLDGDDFESHPFVKNIPKGAGSEKEVLKALEDLRPHVEALREAESSIRKEFSMAMREVAPYAFKTFSDNPVQRDDAILRSGRRRLAALMDGLSKDGTTLASWEQYLCPPVCDDIQLGDILMKADGNCDDPASFRIVLTPSCDLVASRSRKPKVKNVLVARCCSNQDALKRIKMQPPGSRKLSIGNNLKDFKENLTINLLNQGYREMIIPFPCLEGRIPSMAANLKDLELIPFDDKGHLGKDYLPVASIDSPFRELISWAYQQNACRPGLPDRDCFSWADEFVPEMENEEDGKEQA